MRSEAGAVGLLFLFSILLAGCSSSCQITSSSDAGSGGYKMTQELMNKQLSDLKMIMQAPIDRDAVFVHQTIKVLPIFDQLCLTASGNQGPGNSNMVLASFRINGQSLQKYKQCIGETAAKGGFASFQLNGLSAQSEPRCAEIKDGELTFMFNGSAIILGLPQTQTPSINQNLSVPGTQDNRPINFSGNNLIFYPKEQNYMIDLDNQSGEIEKWKAWINIKLLTTENKKMVRINLPHNISFDIDQQRIECINDANCDTEFIWHGIILKADYPNEKPYDIMLTFDNERIVGGIDQSVGIGLGKTQYGYRIKGSATTGECTISIFNISKVGPRIE